MKSYRKELWFQTKQRREFINITPQVEQCLRGERHPGGLLLCNAMHITASVFINDDESGPAPGLRDLAGEAGPGEALLPVPAQHRRGQRRRPPEADASWAARWSWP